MIINKVKMYCIERKEIILNIQKLDYGERE
jgi:hypothetical protein